MNADLERNLDECARGQRRLKRLLGAQFVALVGLTVAFLTSFRSGTQERESSAAAQALRVSELVVVDPQGVERVRIGGDLPDAVIDGKRVPRGESAAGVILYDGTGQERGGYVTWEPSGNVGLTLDTRRRQVTLFVAGPEGGSALQLLHDGDLIELRSDGDGSRLTAVDGGRVVYQQPAIDTLGAEACAAYREALARFSMEEVLNACKQRYPESACKACLESK